MATHAPIQVFDECNLALSALVIAIWLAIGFFLSYKYDWDKGHDIILGTNFIFLAFLLPGLARSASSVQVAASVLTVLWATCMLLWSLGRDDDLEPAPPVRGEALWNKLPLPWRIGILYILEGLWMWFSCLALTVVNSPAVVKHQPLPHLPGWPIAIIAFFTLFGVVLSFPNHSQLYHGSPAHVPGSKGPFRCVRRWGPNGLAEIVFQINLIVIYVTLDKHEDRPLGFIEDSGPLYTLEMVLWSWIFFVMVWFVIEASVSTDSKESGNE